MLDQLMNSIGGDVISSLTEKAGITAEQAEQVMPVAQETLQEGLMKEATSGNVEGILGMFNSGAGLESNGMFGSLKGMFVQNIITKLGLPAPVAAMVAGTGLTGILGGLAGKMGGAGNITQDGLMSSLGMGGAGGLMDAAAGMLGGGGDAAGGLMDAAKGLMGDGADAGGGLMDAAKGLMGDGAEEAGGVADSLKDAAKDKLGDIAGGLFGK